MTDAAPHEDRPDGSSWHPWLLGLLILTMVPRAIDDVIGDLGMRLAAHSPLRFWFPLATGAIEIAGLLAAGVLVDRYGVRRVAALSLLVWAVVIAGLAVLVRDSPALYLIHDGAVFAGLFYGLAVNVAAKRGFSFERRARCLAILDIASVAWLLAAPPLSLAADWPPIPAVKSAWIVGGVVVAGGALVLALVWWATRPRGLEPAPDVPDGRRATSSLLEALALLRRPGVIALVVVMTCHMLVFATLYRLLSLYVVRVRFLPFEAFVRALVLPLVAYAVVKIAAAAWSDARARRTGNPGRARTPFIVAGAALAATIGLLAVVSNASLGLVFWPLAVGMAVFPLVFTLGIDVVPAALVGRFLGLAFAISLAVNLAVFVLASIVSARTHDISSYFYLAALAALVGAVVALAGLRTIEPLETDAGFRRAIGKVFA